MEFCSPTANGKKKEICYSKASLLSIIDAWNTLHDDKIIIKKSFNTTKLFEILNKKFQELLHKKETTFWAWTDILKAEARKATNNQIVKDMIKVENTDLRPAQPKEWINNPVEWLSNYDIDKVLRQYEAIPEFNYKFHGVFSIDFGLKEQGGHGIDLKELLKSGKVRFFGFITNLSRSNEAGTHWTSSFFVFDPSLPSYGGYYYDSTTGKIPQDLIPVFADIKEQAEKLIKKPFPIYVNNKRHQRSNTECGVFSIAFQTRFLLLLRANPNTTANIVVNHPEFNDIKMKKLRFLFFRPNFEYLKKI